MIATRARRGRRRKRSEVEVRWGPRTSVGRVQPVGIGLGGEEKGGP